MKEVPVPDDLWMFQDPGATCFAEDDDMTSARLIVAPNEYGADSRNGKLAIVMIERRGSNPHPDREEVGFELTVHDIEPLIAALRRAAREA